MHDTDIRAIRLAVLASAPGKPVPLALNVGTEEFAMKVTPLEAIATAHMLLKSALDSMGPLSLDQPDRLATPEDCVHLATSMLSDALDGFRERKASHD